MIFSVEHSGVIISLNGGIEEYSGRIMGHSEGIEENCGGRRGFYDAQRGHSNDIRLKGRQKKTL